MYDIKIIAVGKIRENYLRSGIDEYLKRIKPYARIRLVEFGRECFSRHSREAARQKESERILAYLEKAGIKEIILLDEGGKEYSSPEFADMLNSWTGEIAFVIGGALGFSESLKRAFKKRLALSKMTYPHEMARLILIEQIYRSITIARSKEYHY